MGRKLQETLDYSTNSASYLPVKMEQTECSETSEYELQTSGNYPKESIQHLEHGKSLKSRILHLYGEETARDIRLFEKLRVLPACEDGTDRVFRNVGI
jgi:hypothetical protein